MALDYLKVPGEVQRGFSHTYGPWGPPWKWTFSVVGSSRSARVTAAIIEPFSEPSSGSGGRQIEIKKCNTLVDNLPDTLWTGRLVERRTARVRAHL